MASQSASLGSQRADVDPRRRLGDVYRHVDARQGRGRGGALGMAAADGPRNGGGHREDERAREQDHQPPQASSHSGTPRRVRPFLKGLPADPAALSALWPQVERWLMGSLLKRGVDHATAMDACQEVAVRLLTKRKRFESAEHFYRWVNKVAHNLVSNWQRNDHRLSDEEVPERSSPDVAASVEPRLLLEEAVVAVAALSEADRQALAAALRLEDRGRTKRERDRLALQLHRARRRLRDRLEDWWAGLPWWRWSWPFDSAPLTAASNAALGAVVIVERAALAASDTPLCGEAAVCGRSLLSVQPAASPEHKGGLD